LVDSGTFTGLPSEEAISAMAAYAEEQGFGKKTVTYRLRDWGISRQRYWGTPIPMIYCDGCGIVAVPDEDLPVVLPKTVEITGQGKSPLEGESAKHDEWLKRELQVSSGKMQGVFVVGHHPLYLKEPDEKDGYYNIPLEKRKEILALLEGYGVVAMLGGHTHKTIINDNEGIQLVNAEATSKNFDDRPLGFRVWSVEDQKPPTHEFVPLESS